MNEKHQPPTLTLFHLADFTAELERRGMSEIRCEAITLDVPTREGPAWRKYLVVLTALDRSVPAVLVCAIRVGEGWDVFADMEPHYENLDKAEDIVVAHLEANGFTVLSGMYHHAKDGVANAKGLWRFDENKRLVPIEEPA